MNVGIDFLLGNNYFSGKRDTSSIIKRTPDPV